MVNIYLVCLPSHSGTLTLLFALDMRNVPALGRIGDPDDIIASVRVEGGKVRKLGLEYGIVELKLCGVPSDPCRDLPTNAFIPSMHK
jgi:hypothetical protein